MIDLNLSELEPERYELQVGPNGGLAFDRRAFLRGLGGGLVILCLIDRDAEALQAPGRGRRGGGAPVPREISAWLHIAADGTVTAYTGKAEVGQNIRTS